MKKARSISKRSAALALGGAMSLSCLTGALAMAFTGKTVADAAGNVVNVDASMQYQTFDGWGTSLAWWANECGDWTRGHANGNTQRDYIMDLLFSEEGLNWNIARYNVGGGENPTHSHLSYDTNMPGFQPGRGEAYDWENGDGTVKDWQDTVDYRQLWVLDAFQKERAKIAEENGKESDAITEFFSNSPPYWMTVNGCASGRGKATNLADDYVNDYIDYFMTVYKYLVDQGFDIDLLQPFNESSTSAVGWGSAAGNTGSQEGCAISVDQKVTILTEINRRLEELAAENPKYDAGYNLGDEVDTGNANAELNRIEGKGDAGKAVYQNADKLTYHIYGYDIPGAQQIYRRAKANGQKAEMSEITWTVSDVYDPELMTTALDKYSKSIIDIVKYGCAESYVFWQGMENLTGLIKTGWNYGVLHGVYDNPAMPSTVSGFDLASRGLVYQDVRTCKSYYVSGQYSKYIKAGYHIVECDEDRSLAAVSPDGSELVIVKENNSDSAKALDFNLKNFNAESVKKIYTDGTHNWAEETIGASAYKFSDEVTPYSVTTYVIKGTSEAGSAHIVDESARISKTDFAAMQNEITLRGDNEYLYTAGEWKEDNGSFAGKTVYNSGDGDRYVAIRFNGTGIGVLGNRKSDSAVLQYWCDPTLESGALPATPTGEVDTKNDTLLTKQQLLRVNNLEKGWHTVYLKVKKGWLNLDGIFVIDGADNTPAASNDPVITSAVAKDGKLYVSFQGIGSADLDHYVVQYKTGEGAWTDGDTVAKDAATKATIESVTGTELTVRVVAHSSSAVLGTSAESKIKMNTSPDGLLYYVDCATSNLNDGGWGRVYGSCNSVFDQTEGADPVTGLTWGRTSDSTFKDPNWADEDPFSSMFSANNDHKITYKFTIPEAGDYDVTIGGFTHGWGKRTIKVTISGTGVTGVSEQDFTINNNKCDIKKFDVSTTDADTVISVEMASPEGLGLIVITKDGKSIPMLAEGQSNYTTANGYDHSGMGDGQRVYVGSDLGAMRDQGTFNVVMSDESRKTFTVTDGGLEAVSGELTGASAGETYTVAYKVQGSDWNENWPEMTVRSVYALEAKKAITQQESWDGVYYYIDAGTDGDYWREHKFFKGDIQTSDSVYDQAYTGSNGWGHVQSKGNYWGGSDNGVPNSPESSIREIGPEGGYVMTGFTPNDTLTLEIGMNVHNWGGRTAEIFVGGTYAAGKITGGTSVGEIKTNTNGGCVSGTYEVKADAEGNLIILFVTKTNKENPQIAYIRVGKNIQHIPEISSTLPTLSAIKADKSAIFLQDYEENGTNPPAITLSGLVPGATVYVIDSNDMLVDSFKATAATYDWSNWTKVVGDVYGLRFTQAKVEYDADGTTVKITCGSGSPEAVVALPRINVTVDEGTVKAGEKIAIVVSPKLGRVPKEVYGTLDALTIARPDGVKADLIGSFFYRTPKNGAHTLTVVCSGETYTKTIDVSGIEVLGLNAEYSTMAWTNEDVTITLTPTTGTTVEKLYAKKDSQEFADKDLLTATSGQYTITATGNGTWYVKVVTANGSEKTYTYKVDNIDKATEVTLNVQIDFTATGGVKLNYKGNSVAAGALWVKKDDGTPEKVESLNAFTATEPGKYELTYKTDTGLVSTTYTYYVTEKAAEAQLATVAVNDGTVAVTGSGVTAKLYRAGSSTPLSGMDVSAAGKYYLELTKDGNKEVVTINTAETSTADNISVVQPTEAPAEGGSSVDLALTIVFAVLAAAAVAGTVVIVIKRRKA